MAKVTINNVDKKMKVREIINRLAELKCEEDRLSQELDNLID